MGNPDFHPQALQLAGGDAPPGWEWVASSVNARVARNVAGTIYYKEFLPRGPLESLKALVRGSRAERARHHNDALRKAGFSAPANIAWGTLAEGREYLFSSAVPGISVTEWLRGELQQRRGGKLGRRRQLLRELGVFIGRFHAAGFIHGDLRTSNVLANLQGDKFHFALIDNERNTHYSDPPGSGLLRNLMQLNMLLPADLSTRDRMRFFTAWQRQLPVISKLEARVVAVEAYAWAMRRLLEKGNVVPVSLTERPEP